MVNGLMPIASGKEIVDMPNFSKVISSFRGLSTKQQEDLLSEIYSYSEDLKTFLESKLGLETDFDFLVLQMEKETIGKVYKKPTPQIPNGKTINGIIVKAQKAGAPVDVILKLEQLAYRGFIEYLNEYGGGPENFDDMACRHLEVYLKLVKTKVKDPEQERLISEVRKYLLKLNNMITDYVDDSYESITAKAIGRPN